LHVIKQLLEDGHFVRGTVRNLKDEKKTAPIKRLASKNPAQLELVEAELSNADSWQAAVKDMQIVIHVASPFPAAEPEDEQSVIKPAVDGTLNVLRAAAAESKIKRVVVTSSGLAVFGYNWESKTYSEDDWPQADVQPSAYCKSKIIAERAAWDFVEDKKKKNEPCFELSVVNPVLVLGPILSEVYGTSSEWFLNVFQNKQDKVSNMSYPCCDVRDVATAVSLSF
jgi:nucleoside-diphosphate-sugar epimerase